MSSSQEGGDTAEQTPAEGRRPAVRGPEEDQPDEIDERLQARSGPSGLYSVQDIARHRERTRRGIAYLLISILGVLAIGSGILLAVGGLEIQEAKEYLGIVYIPLVTLAGTALGFFFADKNSP